MRITLFHKKIVIRTNLFEEPRLINRKIVFHKFRIQVKTSSGAVSRSKVTNTTQLNIIIRDKLKAKMV